MAESALGDLGMGLHAVSIGLGLVHARVLGVALEVVALFFGDVVARGRLFLFDVAGVPVAGLVRFL